MKLTTKSEYCLLALLYLARHQDGNYIKIEEICRHYQIPKKYLELLFMTLRQNRLIKTRRGIQGGYRLAQPADRISLAAVIRLMDGALAPTESVSTYFFSDTPIAREEKLVSVFQEIRDFIANHLEHTTLQDLI